MSRSGRALYARVLDQATKRGRSVLTAIRKSPVVKNQRGEWTAPEEMVSLKGAVGEFMALVVSTPSRDMFSRPGLWPS